MYVSVAVKKIFFMQNNKNQFETAQVEIQLIRVKTIFMFWTKTTCTVHVILRIKKYIKVSRSMNKNNKG